MIELDGGITLPDGKGKGFSKPKGISPNRWQKMKPEMWRRAYLHCLYTLTLHFGEALHVVVPRLASKMLEATDPKNVALRFMGEMELAGYVQFERGMDERIVMPTKKFLKLNLDITRADHSAVQYPKVEGEKMPSVVVRNGDGCRNNKKVLKITQHMANEEFEINDFIHNLTKKYPPKYEKIKDMYMFDRSMNSARIMQHEKFKFPIFSDSRARHYTDTTCGFNYQGADHEKAIVVPTYAEPLTKEGYKALIESAHGYSEMNWSPLEMALHANDPDKYESTWKSADKPYSYMACAFLIRAYWLDSSTPLPSFPPLDGRCSGLQHWSAVVRSNAITKHLGMHKDEAELDIYEKVAEDWKATLQEKEKKYATRKAAKIPVMTWGYNATMMTAMEHMDKLFGAKQKWDKDQGCFIRHGKGLDRGSASRLGVDLYKGMQNTLGPLQAAVDWVSNAAHNISSQGNPTIHWITPDGVSCMQRKIKSTDVQIGCHLSNGDRFVVDIKDFSGSIPNSAKHKSAIAPNIIHSLDATHLRMVARRLKSLGLPMVFIHDSFATHANYTHTLYSIIVEEFIELYNMNYLMCLKMFWESEYQIELPYPPEMGDWEPDSLQNLTRFFL